MDRIFGSYRVGYILRCSFAESKIICGAIDMTADMIHGLVIVLATLVFVGTIIFVAQMVSKA